HALAAHPVAYLSHRATFMWQFLGRSNLVLPVWDWLDPASAYGHSAYFTPLVPLHDQPQPTSPFRPRLSLVRFVSIAPCALRAPAPTPAAACALGVPASASVSAVPFRMIDVTPGFPYPFCPLPTPIAAAGALGLARRDQIPKRPSADQRSLGSSSGSASTPRM